MRRRRRKASANRVTKRSPRRRRTRRARRNYYGAGVLANRPRRRGRRRARRNVYYGLNPRRRRRSFRRNPAMLAGLSLPPMDAVFFTAAGLVGPNLVSQQLLRVLPTSLTSSPIGQWGVKVASVILPGWALRKFVGERAGNLFIIGGAAGLVMDAIRTFAPGIIPGLGAQPMLGAYTSRITRGGDVRAFPPQGRSLPSMISDAPDRLSPTGRF